MRVDLFTLAATLSPTGEAEAPVGNLEAHTPDPTPRAMTCEQNDVARLVTTALQSEASRGSRIQALKDAVFEGTYHADPEAIALAMTEGNGEPPAE